MSRMEERNEYPQRRRTQSFSSSLLDAIYRSIDESKSNLDEDPHMGSHTSKQSNPSYNNNREEKILNKEKTNLRRAVMIEDWMEKQSSRSSRSFMNSTSSSSECSSGATFFSSSSGTEKTKRQTSENQPKQKNQKGKREGGFAQNTKLRALKIYGELNQKVKQPISPGSRIATFLSSIFNSGNVKKAKMCYVGAVEDVRFEHSSKSPCFSSSASSFSRRSCMSKTPSSSSSSSKGKRSVRFYPVSVILGEDSQSCQRYNFENDPSLLPLPSVRKMTRNCSIKEIKKNKEYGFVKGCPNSHQFGLRDYCNNEDEDEDNDDDALSYSSSDLFELDHLIGGARYQEELPVFETTNLETNKAIANGLRV